MKDLFKLVKAIVKTVDEGKYSEIFNKNIELIETVFEGENLDVNELFTKIEDEKELMNVITSMDYPENDRQLILSMVTNHFTSIFGELKLPHFYDVMRCSSNGGKPILLTMSTRYSGNRGYEEIDEQKYNKLTILKNIKAQYLAICVKGYLTGTLEIEGLSVVNKIKNVSKISSEPTRDNIVKVMKTIDKIMDNKRDYSKYTTYLGSGRTVIHVDGFAVKFPETNSNMFVSGETQNLKEAEVYFSTKHKSLVPIYATHRGCLICKLVLNSQMFEDNLNLDKSEIKSLINCEANELRTVISEFGLNEIDVKAVENWGLDTEDGKFKCLDYGFIGRY